MGDVVSFKKSEPEKDGPWASGMARCLACKHEWVCVTEVPIPKADLECPSCGCFRGAYKGAFEAPEGFATFVCACGNSLLERHVSPQGKERLTCLGCGYAWPL